MLGDVSWENLNLASAFLLGALLATVATLRVMRIVGDYLAGREGRGLLRRRPRADDEGPDQGQPS